MKTINLNRIIKRLDLDKKQLADQLFPMHKYPGLAINRVIQKKAVLDADQISRLSLFTGLTIEQLFESEWKAFAKGKTMMFECEDYKAHLNTETWVTTVFHNGSIFHESVIHPRTIAISDYLTELSKIINKYKNQ